MSIQKLIAEKKELQRSQHRSHAIQNRIDEIDKKIEQKTNQTDQNFFRTFFRTAKEQLPTELFNKVEGIASTRQNNYQSGTK